jgi:hypothetical protein
VGRYTLRYNYLHANGQVTLVASLCYLCVMGIIKTTYDLPDTTALNRSHRLARLAPIRMGKLGYVHDRAADPKRIGRMRIYLSQHPQELGPLIAAVILGEAEKELLLRRHRLLSLLLVSRSDWRAKG